jgi:acetyltransferase-like isoleucine patch superfamily enzyme
MEVEDLLRPIGIFPLIFFLIYLIFCGLIATLFQQGFKYFGMDSLFIFICLFYFISISLYRLIIKYCKFNLGEIPKGSRDEFFYHVYVSIKLFLYDPWLMGNYLPTPIATLFYRFLGLKIGKNSFVSGTICDPHLVKIGNNSYTGYRSTLVPHIMEDEFLSHIPIQIGNHVTIGAGSTILAGVEIDDYAIIGAQSLVRKNTKIGKYEIWGGVPAKKISTRNVK